MKKHLIGTLVGGVILFVWQFLSWAMLGVHRSEFTHTPHQEEILAFLSERLEAEGSYMLPTPPPSASMEEEQRFMERYIGRPWAHVTYHKALNMNMAVPMLRGLAADLLAVWLLIWLLLQFKQLSVRRAVQASVGIGLIAYLTVPYLNSIWFETNSLAYLIDAIVAWSTVGLWVGWWMMRSQP